MPAKDFTKGVKKVLEICNSEFSEYGDKRFKFKNSLVETMNALKFVFLLTERSKAKCS